MPKKQAKSYKKAQKDIAQSALDALLQKQDIKGAVVIIAGAKGATMASSYPKNTKIMIGLMKGLELCAERILEDAEGKDTPHARHTHEKKPNKGKNFDAFEKLLKAILLEALLGDDTE